MPRMFRLAAALVVGAGVLSGCGSAGESTESAESTGSTASGPCEPADTEIRFGVHTEVRGFDVVNGGTVGVAGGAERMAVFDSLMVYDTENKEFVPRMASSFEPNEDFTRWTLTLRDGMTFGSGNPVTTEAVEFSVARHGADDTVSLAKSQMNLIEEMEIVGPLEMVFVLKVPQGDFPAVFASGPGMLADPAVFAEKGAKAFALDPGDGGAGPYKVESYTQGEELVLTRRDGYWGDSDFCAGTLRFEFVENEEARRDAFLNGELDAAVFNDAALIDELRSEGADMHAPVGWGSATVLINHGTGGVERPGSDLRVRKAVAYALHPQAIDERSTGGVGIPSSALMTDRSVLWPDGLEGPPYEPDEARRLLDEAKADGYDGKITLSCDNAQTKIDWAIAVEAMLESVGFEVELDNARALGAHRELFFSGNYDLSCFAMSVEETQPWATFQTTLGQDDVAQGRVGYRSPAMEQAMNELRAAGTTEERQQAILGMQEVWNSEIPMAITGHGERAVVWHDNVEGLRFTVSATTMFDDVRVS